MRWLGFFGALLFVVGIVFTQAEGEKPRALWFIELRGSINPAGVDYLSTALKGAEADDAEALVIELDTPGGLVSSVREMAQLIDRAKIPVVVHVTPAGASATSAGALLSLASHLSAMAPGTNIGAAHPVDSGGKDIEGKMGEKVENDTAAFARGLAEVRGRPVGLAETIVLKSQSFSAQEALDQELIEILARDRKELIEKLNGRMVTVGKDTKRVIRSLGAQVHSHAMTFGQRLLHMLANPNIATLLMTLGMLCIYVELTTPGIGFAGALGAVALLVAFASFSMLPIRTTGLLLLVLGFGLMIAEPFVPTHGALAMGGALSFILGILWVMDPAGGTLRVSPSVWVPAAFALCGGALGIAWVAANMRKQVEQALAAMGGGAAGGLLGYVGQVSFAQAEGRSGKFRVRGEVWDFEVSAAEEPLRSGDRVQVLETRGMRAIVKKIN